eukprot:gene3716-7383_t
MQLVEDGVVNVCSSQSPLVFPKQAEESLNCNGIEFRWKYKHVFLIESLGGNSLMFAKPDKPYQRLHVNSLGHLDFLSGNTRRHLFQIEQINNSEYLKIRSCANKVTVDSKGIYLCFIENGTLTTTTTEENNSNNTCSLFSLKIIKNDPKLSTHTQNEQESLLLQQTSIPKASLPSWQLQRFVLEGYIQIHDFLPQELVSACLRQLNHLVGVVGAITPGGVQVGLGKLGGGLGSCKEIKDLFYGGILQTTEMLLGDIGVMHSNGIHSGNGNGGGNGSVYESDRAQIALRFPEVVMSRTIEEIEWHTDGYRRGKAHDFSLLVGVFLNDVMSDLSGNLFVWPGSHLLLH